MDNAIPTEVSLVAAYPHLQLYLKGIKRFFASIREIKEALLDIPPNILSALASALKTLYGFLFQPLSGHCHL